MTRRRAGTRDQGPSAFNAVLEKLCDSTDALGAALVDAEGETVDYGGWRDPYDIRVSAAEWRLVLGVVHEARLRGLRDARSMTVRAARRSYFVESLPDGYALVVELPRHAASLSPRAVSEAVRNLAAEAGLVLPEKKQQPRWARVEVRLQAGTERPSALRVGDHWTELTILGRSRGTDLGRSELGYLARLSTGAEVFLVREPLGRWFVDDVNALI